VVCLDGIAHPGQVIGNWICVHFRVKKEAPFFREPQRYENFTAAERQQ
jgi:hypothetical protein